ncbi:hypothetical protein KSX_87350 [Ktedonospora formicarum]|uniref:Uncharacterized protein n=1 Tax=Ktedonospora formicarum TaxID=2778364 RepID=A0A8J3ID58_9CHLR|nr:hypothetical protein KSX_87350 [Ktedonospora formicarum]
MRTRPMGSLEGYEEVALIMEETGDHFIHIKCYNLMKSLKMFHDVVSTKQREFGGG